MILVVVDGKTFGLDIVAQDRTSRDHHVLFPSPFVTILVHDALDELDGIADVCWSGLDLLPTPRDSFGQDNIICFVKAVAPMLLQSQLRLDCRGTS